MDEEQLLREEYEENGSFESTSYESEGSGCAPFAYIALSIVAVLALIGVWRYFALIGSFPTQGGYINIVNAAEVELDTEAIEAAARLLDDNFGIAIDVYIFEAMADEDYNEAFWGYREFLLDRDYGSLPPNQLVIVIGVEEQYSEISWGAALDRLDGERIRGEVMNPRLNEGDYTGALVRSFEASIERLQNGRMAFDEVSRGYAEYADEVLIVCLVLFFIFISFYLQATGSYNGSSDTPYRRSSWSGFRSGSGSGSSRSSGSSGRSSGGGSSRGSWKD